MTTNNDSAWKDILDVYFKDFLDYCLPDLSALIDWTIPWVSLDKELLAITKDGITGTRIADKLIKVFLKDGAEHWVLFHVEVQGKPEEDLPKRMFIYATRIYDKYQVPLASCAILTDTKKTYRPNRFEITLGDSSLSCKFIVIKIIDYENQYQGLEQSANPFASVILSQLEALKAKQKSPREQFNVKRNLTRRLYHKGYDKKAILRLYFFIDWLLQLPKELEAEYKQAVYEFEEETHMPYVSSIERMGIEQGRQEGILAGRQEGILAGRQEGEAELLIRQLTRRFGSLPTHYYQRIKQADTETLLTWGERIFEVNTLAEIFNPAFEKSDS